MWISYSWLFIGILVGMLFVAVFTPPARKDIQIPSAKTHTRFKTNVGCVKFKSKEVPCTEDSTSLNFMAEQ